jgi:hypothetical protein
MNERIKELAKQLGPVATIGNWGRVEWADNVYPQLGDKMYASIDLEKFAELVVAECIEQVRGEFLPVLEDETMMKDTHWDGYVQCGVDSVVAIREHFFGVEE